MGPSHHQQQQQQISKTLFTLLIFIFTLQCCSSNELTNFVFKGCANQKFPSTGPYTQSLTTLFNNLMSQSTTTKFSKTTTGTSAAISGLFQCRGDLSPDQCSTCVSQIPDMSSRLCGPTIAGRIQLTGCYLRYEVVGFQTVGPTELLYKICGSTRVSGTGFSDRVNSALNEIVKGLVNANGFYAGGFESVYVLGQCEGDLASNECVNCVKSAVSRVKSECGGDSISAQIYLQECYISYAYHPNGVPSNSLSPSGSRQNTQRTVALVLGGLVALGLIVACLLFTKSAFKKKSYTKYGG